MQLQDDLKVILYSRGLLSERDATGANKRWKEATWTRHDIWAGYIPREPRLTNHATQLRRQLWLKAFCLLTFRSFLDNWVKVWCNRYWETAQLHKLHNENNMFSHPSSFYYINWSRSPKSTKTDLNICILWRRCLLYLFPPSCTHKKEMTHLKWAVFICGGRALPKEETKCVCTLLHICSAIVLCLYTVRIWSFPPQ